ncbi:double-strand break repair helicase AddA [Roseicyclus persicicus]|uniref:DNA 3'-5' helicase n=1 Tax=Roseicyclus persicicus TaxID=2650661 RepID=A0A7X6GZM3_9RHOB|nr:double-strand break repair helicase AddA [Roseibacterium persicicum]NKX45286.1 double-strand break repair helicase AddA [Roseibacterium persicicum]
MGRDASTRDPARRGGGRAVNDASRAQVEAARPDTSTWLSANAGSGKTRVLTDRVARLLLRGVRPERILCLTYTKAAAMEMQNRLFQRLGEWAMKPDADLRAVLAEIGEGAIDADALRHARTLFARAIEAPGGLKIQTIHSFCAAVLRRFPLEAGVSPGFTEIDERVQARLIADLLDALAGDAAGQGAIDGVAALMGDDDGLMRLAKAAAGRAEALEDPWDWPAICDWAGIDPGATEADIAARVLVGGEAALAARVLPHLDPDGRSTSKPHAALRDTDWAAPGLADLEKLEDAFLTGSTAAAPFSAKIDAIGNKAVRTAIGADMDALNALMLRIEAARPLRLAFLTARRVHALHRFAAAFLPAYARAKALRGWLDFDDLIRATRRLLTDRSVAQWVLFRLDGGIDHILVDEAQDTSPAQWQIVERLAEEFAAGEGARADTPRTVFVVGDKKQSIYSFQGADPAGFDRMRDHFAARHAEVGLPFQSRELLHSFRSSPVILSLVDAVAARAGGPGVGDADGVEHRAFHGDKPGRVDLWPVVPPAEKPPPVAWDDPQDIRSEDHPTSLLARAIADRIAAMLAAGEPIPHKGGPRPITPGDILILVQSRSPLFRKIIAALKEARLPVAGVDRAAIAEPLAVKDLIALLRFLALPEDDLSLACVLRSPIAGWSEDALFRLAHGRGGRYLWPALQDARDRHPETVAMLEDLRRQADFLRPYDLLERVLIRHDARRRLVARLGPEAEDGIDALLAQALAYEAIEVPSLTGFVGWLEAGEVTVKRDLARPNGQIRVMTVHGAKGLEAPVVILPDTGVRQGRGGGGPDLVTPEGGPLVWARKADATDPVLAALEARATAGAEERNRLLYVAMTRAESWLIVAAAGKVANKAGDPADSWYAAIRDGMEALGAAPHLIPEIPGGGLRLQAGDWTCLPPAAAATDRLPPLPGWALTPAPPSRREDKARTPSDLGGAKVIPGATEGLDEQAALRRGRLVHLLLEHLPRVPAPGWPAAAPGILSLEPGAVAEAERAGLLAEATRVLTAPDLRFLFAADALAEVTLTGTLGGAPMLGVIDRLLVGETRVLAVDFKTNAAVPDRAEDTPEGLLRQMGAYAALLAPLYPGRRIETAILWTRTARLMPLPHDLVSAALSRASGA